jgi:penicillin amidase
VHVRREPVIVRWWRQEEISVRETAFGPVVTDARMLRAGKKQALALRWLGHRSSDEITAMLRVGRARDWQEFRAALEGYAVPGLTMVYADAKGHIGKAMAATLPLLPAGALPDLVTPAAQAEWDSFVTSADLPFRFDPPEGFVVSANERPVDAAVTVGYFFSPGDRARRLGHLLSTKRAVTVGDLSAILSDVYSSSAVALRDALLSALSRHSGRAVPERLRLLIERLAAWDGYYFADSGGALALELLLYNFNRRFFGHARLAAFDATWQSRHFVLRDIGRAAPEQVAAALARAVGPAARALSRLRDWGGAHRLRLLHPLGLVPIIGRRYRFADRPSAGGAETVFKTAHDWVRRRHAVRYGSTARYVFDLADMDRNYFVLLGGQDGRPGSTTFLDQLALWGENGFMQVPLRPETVRSRFAFKTELIPKGGKGQSAARSRPREQPDA